MAAFICPERLGLRGTACSGTARSGTSCLSKSSDDENSSTRPTKKNFSSNTEMATSASAGSEKRRVCALRSLGWGNPFREGSRSSPSCLLLGVVGSTSLGRSAQHRHEADAALDVLEFARRENEVPAERAESGVTAPNPRQVRMGEHGGMSVFFSHDEVAHAERTPQDVVQ